MTYPDVAPVASHLRLAGRLARTEHYCYANRCDPQTWFTDHLLVGRFVSRLSDIRHLAHVLYSSLGSPSCGFSESPSCDEKDAFVDFVGAETMTAGTTWK
jgi:hypothetical protein